VIGQVIVDQQGVQTARHRRDEGRPAPEVDRVGRQDHRGDPGPGFRSDGQFASQLIALVSIRRPRRRPVDI
jgi:hypothetical protein